MVIKTKNMILTGLFAALTAIGAYIVVPVGPAPITLQLLFTVMSGVFLGARFGALSQIIYILMGLAGLPVFAGGAGGVSYIFAPSFGYVIGFVAAAFIVGKMLENDKKPSFLKILLSCLLGTAVIYVIGYPYLYLVLTKVSGAAITFQGLLKPAVLIFLPGDLVKIIIAAYAGRKMVPIIKR